jgi:hypothetical protein
LLPFSLFYDQLWMLVAIVVAVRLAAPTTSGTVTPARDHTRTFTFLRRALLITGLGLLGFRIYLGRVNGTIALIPFFGLAWLELMIAIGVARWVIKDKTTRQLLDVIGWLSVVWTLGIMVVMALIGAWLRAYKGSLVPM